MKSVRLFISFIAVILCLKASSQNQLPSIKIKSLAGKEVSFETLFAESDMPVVVSL